MKKSIFLLIGFGICCSFASAQEEVANDSSINSTVFKQSFGRFSLNYASDWIYAGRKDVQSLPYLTAAAGYFHRSGLFLRGAASLMLSGQEKRVDQLKITGGYAQFKNNLFWGIHGSLFAYNDSSYALMAEINASAYGYLGYDFSLFELTADAGTLFGNATDLTAGLELSKTVYANNGKIRLIPSVYLLGGSQRYYNAYYQIRSTETKKRIGRGNGSGSGTVVTTDTTVVVENSSRFKLLSYEFSLSAQITAGRFRFGCIPAYIIPINPSSITIDQVTTSEKLENSFYFSASVAYRLD
jgi:hypothetical protein